MYISKFLRRFAAVLLIPLMVSACDTPPIATSHAHDTADGSHRGVQITMQSGVYGSPTQTVLVIYNNWNPLPIATVTGQSKRLDAQLVDALLNLGPAIVTGQYRIKAEEVGCPPGTLCGTLVQVSNQAGAEVDVSATSGTTAAGS